MSCTTEEVSAIKLLLENSFLELRMYFHYKEAYSETINKLLSYTYLKLSRVLVSYLQLTIPTAESQKKWTL